MEPTIERYRRITGMAVLGLLFLGILTGAVLFGRIVGDAIGTAYVEKGPSAEDLPPFPVNPAPPGENPQTAAKPGQPEPSARAR